MPDATSRPTFLRVQSPRRSYPPNRPPGLLGKLPVLRVSKDRKWARINKYRDRLRTLNNSNRQTSSKIEAVTLLNIQRKIVQM